MERDEYRYCDTYFRRWRQSRLNIVFVHLFEKVLKWIQPEDYKLTV